MAPWNVPNTDGFDLRGTNITLYDTTISNGDDDVAIGATATDPTGQVTIRRVATYAHSGLSILGNGDNQTGGNISDLLFEDITQRANVPGLVVNTDGTGVVNGIPSAEIQAKWNISDYRQALPNSTGTVQGLDIRYTSNSADRVPDITNITYRNVCVKDIDDLTTCFEDSARSVLCERHLLFKENWRKNEFAGFDPEVICGIKHGRLIRILGVARLRETEGVSSCAILDRKMRGVGKT
jgi:hypothetical protein